MTAGMTRGERTWSLAGAALMVLGAFGTWATAVPDAGASVAIDGFGEGAEVALALGALAAAAALVGHRLATALVALAAAAWIAFVVYSLPGELTSGRFQQAEIAWGAGVALLGALAVLVAATLRPAAPYFEGRRRRAPSAVERP